MTPASVDTELRLKIVPNPVFQSQYWLGRGGLWDENWYRPLSHLLEICLCHSLTFLCFLLLTHNNCTYHRFSALWLTSSVIIAHIYRVHCYTCIYIMIKLAYFYNGILFSHKGEWISVTHSTIVVLFYSTFSETVFIYLFENEPCQRSSTFWFTLQQLWQSELAQTKTRSLELHPGLPLG